MFVLVEGALLYAIFRFRGKPDDPEPRQMHGNTTIEIIWTVIPALILAAIAVPTVRGIFETSAIPAGDALKVEVVGHQWWWEFRYPDLNITTANEVHIPVGQTVSFRMSTADVVHSFWPPRFAGKRDVFPNRETRLWFKAEQAGEYPGQCAEFCGIQHGRMAFRVRAQTPEEFQSLGGAHADAGRQAGRGGRGSAGGLRAHGQRRRQRPGPQAKQGAAPQRHRQGLGSRRRRRPTRPMPRARSCSWPRAASGATRSTR